MRTAYYVVSTHWDREWYDTFQGFRMRFVSMFDEVMDTLEAEPAFASFEVDGPDPAARSAFAKTRQLANCRPIGSPPPCQCNFNRAIK
jgi:hypothetical protein